MGTIKYVHIISRLTQSFGAAAGSDSAFVLPSQSPWLGWIGRPERALVQSLLLSLLLLLFFPGQSPSIGWSTQYIVFFVSCTVKTGGKRPRDMIHSKRTPRRAKGFIIPTSAQTTRTLLPLKKREWRGTSMRLHQPHALAMIHNKRTARRAKNLKTKKSTLQGVFSSALLLLQKVAPPTAEQTTRE